MFEGLNILVIRHQQDLKDVDKLELTIENFGGRAFVKEESDNALNYVEQYEINHIITDTIQFIEYDLAKQAMIPITTADWIYDSLQVGKQLQVSKYNPDSKYFLKRCFVCIGDDIPILDKEIIYGGVKAFGGMYLDKLTSATTHLITNDLESEKTILAESSDLTIFIVKPNWIDDCFKMGKKLPESDYFLDNGHPGAESNMLIDESNISDMLRFNTSFFNGKKFYISSDFRLSKDLKSAITALISKNGGKVVKFSDKIDIYIGKYRSGNEFKTCFQNNRIIIGNLQWLYSIIVNNQWELPINSQLLHYPIPLKPLTKFRNLKISVTNYSHDARYYLSQLITILGGTFTKTLTKENDYLIVGKATGAKYEAAKDKWVVDGEPIVKIVNHLWLEECFSKWELLDTAPTRYQYLGYNEDLGVENLVGRTKLNREVLKNWVDLVDDSMDDDILQPGTDYSEDETAASQEEAASQEAAFEAKQATDMDNLPTQVSEDSEQEQEQEETQEPTAEPTLPEASGEVVVEAGEVVADTREPTEPADEEHTEVEYVDTPEPKQPAYDTPSRGRSAKAKAAMKLHDDMTDLIQHQQLLKNKRKMNEYMKELENTPERKKKAGKENITPPKKQKSTSQAPVVDIIAILTGCEKEIDLSREELGILRSSGIRISAGGKINTLIAPKILRTEKFLTSLSKVQRIVHPQYLKDFLSDSSIDVEDYRLDKIVGVEEINKQLGYETTEINGIEAILNASRGHLFKDYKLNLSANLNGGYDVLAKILNSHGVQQLKSITAKSKDLLESNGETIVVVNSQKDAKLMSVFKDHILVEWDWCVKSIFKQEVQPFIVK